MFDAELGIKRDSWQEVSIRLKSKYKFTIAAENSRSDGYTSEKLLTSFLAHSVPIYWGNPYVAEEYNPEAFINCSDYDNFDSVVKRVREIDENDELWAHIVSQPWQTEQQRNNSKKQYEHYKKFMVNIFTQPLNEASRHFEGWFYIYEYGKWFFSHEISYGKKPSYLLKILKLLFKPKLFMIKLKRNLKFYFMRKITLEEFLMRKNQ
ncbi:MAG: hypothetical protein IJU48_05475 [Synergistaceae bacterium]|nr:hypothetical protein [Synergistaceae bacterium]